jgi:hypothetical protein
MSEPRDAGRSAFSLLFGSPLVFFVLCPLSFVATGIFLGFLQDSNRARLWHMLMALQPALWLASVLVVFKDFRSHRLDWPVRGRERMVMVLCTLLAWLMNSFPFLVQLITQRWALPEDMDALFQLPHLRAKLVFLGLLSAVVATLHTTGMLSVHVQLLASPREPTARGGAPEVAGLDDEVLRYQRLRGRLARSLVFSAITIGTATLSLGAFRDLLIELDPSQVFAPSVLGYGVYYTGLLASVYLPTRKTLTDMGEALAARFVSSSPVEGMSWKDWSQEQGAVRTWLGLQGTALQDLQQGLSVLAPLFASLSALALGAGG